MGEETMEDYMDASTGLLYDMRLRIEGAVVLYETDALPLRQMAIENNLLTAANALDTIGAALYDLRHDIRQLHTVHIQEADRAAGMSK